jgi:hypothetical protein
VQSVGPDVQDPAALVIRLDSVPGLNDPSLKIAQEHVESFLTILDVDRQEDLVGCNVRVTIDEEWGSERVAFLTRSTAIAVRESAQSPRDEVAVYDALAVGSTSPAAADDECQESTAALTPAEQAVEEVARADLAAAAAAPADQRYFLYRETYEQGPRPSVIELTPAEFALLGGSAAYLHVDDCALVATQDLPPEAAQGIERLLERAASRPEANVSRAELERLTVAGHVVSCAVY